MGTASLLLETVLGLVAGSSLVSAFAFFLKSWESLRPTWEPHRSSPRLVHSESRYKLGLDHTLSLHGYT